MKFKPPKRFYTPEQLAEHWECKVEDINHLIDTKQLETADKGAAREGKSHLRTRLFYDWSELGAHDDTDEVTVPIVDSPNSEISPEETIKHEMEALVDAGEFDQVILAAEVSRFEREHGEPTDDTAPPSSWPWGDYENPKLRLMADVVDHFCVQNDLDRFPKKPVVVNWIMDRMKTIGMPASNSLAESIETLIAPRIYVHHRQRKQK